MLTFSFVAESVVILLLTASLMVAPGIEIEYDTKHMKRNRASDVSLSFLLMMNPKSITEIF